MMLIQLVLAAIATAEAPKVQWSAPDLYISGGALRVHVDIESPKEGGPLQSWMLETSGFTVNGKPLTERRDVHTIQLAPGTKVSFDIDIGSLVADSKGFDGKNFKLGYGQDSTATTDKEIRYMQGAPKGLDFMDEKKTPVADLSKYHVLLQTNRGDMEVEFWPDVAPLHVRNFLDLSYSGFYDGKIFHRVIPGFMIQGGDPTGTGSGNGPRMLKAEFSSRKHEPGVLSMARTSDPNSASCQFFVMHKAAPNLDGQYSAFGKLVNGLDVVEKIVNARRNSQDKPFEPQTIVKATVIQAPAK